MKVVAAAIPRKPILKYTTILYSLTVDENTVRLPEADSSEGGLLHNKLHKVR